MLKPMYFIIFIVLLATSCATININKEPQQKTTHTKQLGSIGDHKNYVLEQDYNSSALPTYTQPIKVTVTPVIFNQSTIKAFQTAKTYQNTALDIKFQDSTSEQSKFLKLDIADRVAVLDALKSNQNQSVLAFIKNNKNAELTTSISIAFDEVQLNNILQAEEVFLEQTGIKTYALSLYKDKTLQSTIALKNGVVFAYQHSNFCWKQNEKYQVELIDIVETNDQCPRQSYPSGKRAKKRINYYKF